jgi:transcription antitermination factor NusG
MKVGSRVLITSGPHENLTGEIVAMAKQKSEGYLGEEKNDTDLYVSV